MKIDNLLPITLAVAGTSAQQTAWGQCGGTGWTGATTCVSGYTCTYSNPYYSQCLPGTAASTTTKAGTTLTTSTTKAATTTATSTGGSSPSSLGWKWLGVDESGAEFGSTVIPGTWGVDFTFPADSSLSVRQPRLQPSLPLVLIKTDSARPGLQHLPCAFLDGTNGTR
jgi:hypothetical protein